MGNGTAGRVTNSSGKRQYVAATTPPDTPAKPKGAAASQSPPKGERPRPVDIHVGPYNSTTKPSIVPVEPEPWLSGSISIPISRAYYPVPGVNQTALSLGNAAAAKAPKPEVNPVLSTIGDLFYRRGHTDKQLHADQERVRQRLVDQAQDEMDRHGLRYFRAILANLKESGFVRQDTPNRSRRGDRSAALMKQVGNIQYWKSVQLLHNYYQQPFVEVNDWKQL